MSGNHPLRVTRPAWPGSVGVRGVGWTVACVLRMVLLGGRQDLNTAVPHVWARA